MSPMADSLYVLTVFEYGWSVNMERIKKTHAFGDNFMTFYLVSKSIMVMNSKHTIVNELAKRGPADKSNQTVQDLTSNLFDTSLPISDFNQNTAFG